MKPILITCYVSPDLDGVAGAVAYGEFLQKAGKDVVVGIIGELNDEAGYIFDRFGFSHPKTVPDADGYDEVILVDASELSGLEGKIPAEKVIEIIDHRTINDADKFPNAKAQIELVGAAATLVAEKFIQNKADISKESATLLYGAIVSNTLNFKGSVTTERDRVAAVWLNQTAGLPEAFGGNFLWRSRICLAVNLPKELKAISHGSPWVERRLVSPRLRSSGRASSSRRGELRLSELLVKSRPIWVSISYFKTQST